MPSPSNRSSRKSSRGKSSRSSSASGGAGGFLLGVLVTAAIAAGAVFYFHIRLPWMHSQGRNLSRSVPPAAQVADQSSDDRPKPPPLPSPPATAPRAPFPTSEDVFEAGARLYVKADHGTSCATCHGTPNRLGARMESSPGAAQFFIPNNPVTHSPSQLFIRTKYGVTGAPAMPAYAGTLTDTQIWQIALLLSHAGEALPDPVTHILAAHK